MDTRSKIVGAEGVRLRPQEPGLCIVTGYFDVLTGGHIRELAQIRRRAATMAAVVLPLAGELLGQRARAELVAGLRMIDYVITIESERLEGLIAELRPAEVVRLEAADQRRRQELIEHVQRRQIR